MIAAPSLKRWVRNWIAEAYRGPIPIRVKMVVLVEFEIAVFLLLFFKMPIPDWLTFLSAVFAVDASAVLFWESLPEYGHSLVAIFSGYREAPSMSNSAAAFIGFGLSICMFIVAVITALMVALAARRHSIKPIGLWTASCVLSVCLVLAYIYAERRADQWLKQKAAKILAIPDPDARAIMARRYARAVGFSFYLVAGFLQIAAILVAWLWRAG